MYRGQPIYNVKTMEEAMADELTSWRQYFMLLGVFAGIAATLAMIGVYGLVAYEAGQRAREIGIRRALGAGAGAVMGLVLRQGLLLIAVGIAGGIVVSLGATQVLEGLLWGVSPTDPTTFAVVAASLAAVAILACCVPASRTLTINPMVALRND